MAFMPVAVNLDGASYWVSSTISSLSDSANMTAFVVAKVTTGSGSEMRYISGPSNRFKLVFNTGGQISAQGLSNSSTTCINGSSTKSGGYFDGAWHAFLLSRVSAGDWLFAADGVTAAFTTTTNTGLAIQFSASSTQGVLATNGGTNICVGDVSHLWFKAGVGFDLTDPANIDLFMDTSGRLRDLGTSGVVAGVTPDVWFNDWTLNRGSLGNIYTLTGSLPAASTAPEGVPDAGPVYAQTAFRLYNDDGTGLGPPP